MAFLGHQSLFLQLWGSSAHLFSWKVKTWLLIPLVPFQLSSEVLLRVPVLHLPQQCRHLDQRCWNQTINAVKSFTSQCDLSTLLWKAALLSVCSDSAGYIYKVKKFRAENNTHKSAYLFNKLLNQKSVLFKNIKAV